MFLCLTSVLADIQLERLNPKSQTYSHGGYMGRTFDVLQQLQRQMTAKRFDGARPSVTRTEPDGAMEKEVQSTGGKYREYPPLDRTRLRQGYQLCLGNASALLMDATRLREAGSLRTAYLILLLAVEELRNAMQLYEAGC